jgi:hypothetical protein
MPEDFDVFLSYNRQDEELVGQIGERLRARGLRVWQDQGELRPGLPWQEGLEEGIQASRAVAVFVGEDALGAWQTPEMRAFIARSRHEKVPVIPVLVPGCPDSPQLTLFLQAFTWVDLRAGLTEEGLARLAWGITGAKLAGHSSNPKTPKRRWSWGIGLALLGVVLTLGAWLWLRAPTKPEMYEVRVQVVDPQGRPVEGSKIRASAGNEPHLLPDGWWEIQIPTAKAPADGHISLWAEHKQWEGSHKDLNLGSDPNPQVQISLKQPETWLRGRVVDRKERGLSGVRVSRQDGLPGETITDAEGRFALKLSVPPETRVWLRSEHASSPPGDDLCYAGRDSCWIVLEKR